MTDEAPKPKPRRNRPIKTVPAAEDPGRKPNGTFAPGHPFAGGGRPRGPNFRALVLEHGEKGVNMSLQEMLLAVYRAVLTKALKGDMTAAKLLLDRVCEQDAVELNISTTTMTDVERAARLKALLEDARSRMPGDGPAAGS